VSVDQRKIVDAVGTDKVTGVVVLTIADQLDWADVSTHLRILQEKIDDYLNFLESGELLTAYPATEGKKVKINIMFRYAPLDGDVFKFLSRVQTIVEQAGYLLSHGVFEGRE
jgi:hypothetical protein